MQTAGRILLFILIAFISVLGVRRIHMEADLTAILPEKVAQIQAVKSFNQYFQDDRNIVVWVQANDDRVSVNDTADLAEYVQEQLSCKVTYDSGAGGNHEDYVKDIAEVWALSKPEVVTDLMTSLNDDESVRNHLIELKEQVRRSLQSGQAIKNSYDPFRLVHHPGVKALGSGEYSFESRDKQSRFLFIKVTSGELTNNYKNDEELVSKVRSTLAKWNAEYENLFTFGLTGGPVYNAEVGTGMQKDLLGTVGISLALIGVIFLIIQRSFIQLIALIVLVAVTFFLTLGVAGWVMPTISVLSVGFATILLGLVIDYAIVILREASHFSQNRTAIRKGIRPSVIWAAITTSLVFSILMLSSFPGVQQLGILILIGLACGATVMIYGMPWLLEVLPDKKQTPPAVHRPRISWKPLLVPVCLITVGVFVFFLRGTPAFDFSLQKLQPTTGEATEVQNSLTEKFNSWSDLRTSVFASARSPEELEQKIHRAQQSSTRLINEDLITDMQLPSGLIPRPDAYHENITTLRTLLNRWDQLHKIALEQGFTAEATRYNRKIIEEFSNLPDTYEEFQQRGRRNGITKRMIAIDNGTIYLRGNVTLAKPLTPESMPKMIELNSDGVVMTGWSTLTAALEPVVRRDFNTIFPPAVIIIIIALIVVFRSWKESLLVLLVLVTSLIVMNSLMVLTHTSWNFLNVIAFPLIIGIGIDYSIHLIFALRRQGSASASVARGVGIAITFCGLSSFIGFGSLNFAQNEVLRSLGFVCSIGVMVTLFLTLLVIPPVWRRWCKPKG